MARWGQANCIEGAVLFASLLENIGIEPLVVLLPGYALLGWRIWNGMDEYDFLETTLIGTGTFQQALDEGHALYENAIRRQLDRRQLFDPEGFLRSVDIIACRKKGIYSLM